MKEVLLLFSLSVRTAEKLNKDAGIYEYTDIHIAAFVASC